MSISIITRTCNRLVFLHRLLPYLKKAAQSFDVEWIIVNDGAKDDPKLLSFIDEVSSLDSFNVRYVECNAGSRPKAANSGLKCATKDYIHILDDDDTISPTFYQKTIDFLGRNDCYGGVCTLSERIDETIDDNGVIKQIAKNAHYPELCYISFANMALTQQFPPVAFVGRRICFDKVGGFDETLNVCEDYDYFLRFLYLYDIGVIAEPLCAFHHRQQAKENLRSEWRNAPNASNHLPFESLLRNRYFRRDLAAGQLGLGWLLVIGELSATLRRIDILLAAGRKLPGVAGFLRRFRR